ncbi:MAG TPA: methyltransferase domain-containing protein [Alphaproteobacteria bacterium]|nr:methyltransferase domain-containing protein [Alphaproteobacteria bacterium]
MALLESETFGYQRIALPFGLSTSGEDRSQTAKLVFPDDLTGKTVLDLGCSYGFFCFEAKRRGATRVVGIDVDPEVIRKARILASILTLEIDFRITDIEAEPISERFDYVLSLNLLHHMRDPVAILHALGAITRERLVLEVASLGRRDRKRLGIGWLSALLLSRQPIIVAGASGPSFNRNVQRFYFTRKAIRTLLLKQHGWFASLSFSASPHKGRFVVLAQRRRIDHLVLVTGPTSSGKSTLIDRLWKGDLPQLSDRIGLTDKSDWPQPINTNHLFENSPASASNVIWHYDFLRPYYRTSKTYERDEALEALTCAEKVTVITVWTPPERLRAQFFRSEIERRGKKRRSPASHHLKILKQYEDDRRVLGLYKAWFAYVQGRAAEHLVVTLDETGLTVRTPMEWAALDHR